MKARVYQPAKTAMQSGRAKDGWLYEYEPAKAMPIDPLMGWVGMQDTTRQIRLFFDSREEAVNYAEQQGVPYTVIDPKQRKIKPKAYADNFRFDKKPQNRPHP